MKSQRSLSGVAALLFALALFAAVGAKGAAADSASLSIADAGSGRMAVSAEITVDNCPGPFCSWYATLRERHSSLPCADDPAITPGLSGFEEEPKTIHQTWTFNPFFPRFAKLCLYVHSTQVSAELLAEASYVVPAGYGRQRSSAYTCSSFGSRGSAQYYLYLYPDDPSHLDPDRDGLACESNPCPCAADPIPAEPVVMVPPPPPITIPATPYACTSARADERRVSGSVKIAERRLTNAYRPGAKRRWRGQLRTRKAKLRRAKQHVVEVCPAV